MIDINDYILLPKEDRQQHIRLLDPCIERGGPPKGGLSAYCKGLMAHILNTTIPSGHRIYVCHACNNDICSNPDHLYWGTAKENHTDAVECGALRSSVWENMIAKYGYEGACIINAKGKSGNKNGAGNNGKIKSDTHKQKISESVKEKHKRKKESGIVLNSGRKRIVSYDIITDLVKKNGFKNAAAELDLSVAALKGRYYNAIRALNK